VVQRVLTVAVPATVLAAVAWSSGGYFPRSWGALLLVVAIGLAAVGILSSDVEFPWRAVVLVGSLFGLAVWQVVTTAWSLWPDSSVLEAERTLIYAGAAALAVVAVPRARGAELVLAVLAGTGAATIGGLVEHAVGAGAPADRLELPIGYPNAAGILATTTLLIGLGLTASDNTFRRSFGGGVIVPAAVALALSLSRGSILAALLGVVVLVVAGMSLRALLTAVVVAAPAAVAVGLVTATGDFGDEGASAREVLVLLAVAALALASAGLAVVRRPGTVVKQEAGAGRSRRRAALLGASAVAALAVFSVAIYVVGESRSTPTTLAGSPDRLLSSSTSSRGDYWRVAARMVEHHPVVGAGAGAFARAWLRERPALLFVQDAHNLYLETLAELGPVGLALLVAALVTPLLGAGRVAGRATSRAALAAYVALLGHAALDWDWELPAVSLCTILLGVALVRLEGSNGARGLAASGRAAILAGATLLAAFAVVIHAGNGATADANELLDRGDAAGARLAAERAHGYRPWAAEPWELLGEAELAEGRTVVARSHLRHATRKDPGAWNAWLSLALATTGSERSRALERARSLNPLAPELQALSRRKNP
jgi:hypothetical protein